MAGFEFSGRIQQGTRKESRRSHAEISDARIAIFAGWH